MSDVNQKAEPIAPATDSIPINSHTSQISPIPFRIASVPKPSISPAPTMFTTTKNAVIDRKDKRFTTSVYRLMRPVKAIG